MNPEIKQEWIEALESGKYKQTREKLRDDTGFCCLGVLCDLAVKKGIAPEWDVNLYGECSIFGAEGSIPHSVAKALGFVNFHSLDGVGNVLVEMNDTDRKSFAEIAEFIRHSKLL